MCHLLLILPLIALPVFWIWPLYAALPVYLAVAGISGVIYWYALRVMRQPGQNGAEGMVGETGRIVVGELGEMHVQIRNELWSAVSPVPLHEGDRVKVVGAEGTRLQVLKLEADTTPAGMRLTETRRAG